MTDDAKKEEADAHHLLDGEGVMINKRKITVPASTWIIDAQAWAEEFGLDLDEVSEDAATLLTKTAEQAVRDYLDSIAGQEALP